VLSRSASALPTHASSAYGASRATNIYISLVANSASNLVGAAFGVLPLVGGVLLYQRVRANTATRKADEWERTVLQVAKRHHGIVTAMDVASNSALTLEQAKDTLDQLNLKGFNEMDVSELGTIVYKFRV